jgi:hypothetical protein
VSDIFQEVQEEYRREQMAKLWSKYRVPLIGAAAALIVAVAGYQGWTYWHNKVLDESSRQFEAALALMEKEHGQERAAAAAFAKLSQDGAGGYAFAAKLQEAAVRAAAGDNKAAIAIYDQISNEGGGDVLFADYARIRAAVLLVDTAPLKEIQKRLDHIAGSDSAWRIEAEELLGYAHWRAGDKAEALRLLDLVKNNPEAPEGTKRRATELSALIVGGMTVADLKAAPAVSLTAPSQQPQPLVPDLPTFDLPQPASPDTPTNPTSPTNTPTP